jgi:hypothetical protein
MVIEKTKGTDARRHGVSALFMQIKSMWLFFVSKGPKATKPKSTLRARSALSDGWGKSVGNVQNEPLQCR